MRDDRRRFDAEIAGALAPELEGAAHSRAHTRRIPPPQQTTKDGGDSPSAKTNLPSAPQRP